MSGLSLMDVLLHYSYDDWEWMVMHAGHQEVNTRFTYLGCQVTWRRRPPGHDDACWYVQLRLPNDVRLDADADAVRGLAVMTCARRHNGWMAQIAYIDISKGSGLVAAATNTGTELTFVDGSVRVDELDILMCNKGIDGHFFRVCERAQCRPYVGESSWS